MVRDVNLMLLNPSTGVEAMSASAVIGAAVTTEGGFFAMVRIKMGTIETGSSPTLDIDIQASIDGGVYYNSIGKFPRLDAADDDIEIARVCWVPHADVAGGVNTVLVRLYGTISGTADYDISWAYLEPLVSLGGPVVDIEQRIGLELLTFPVSA
jgi:hypothetical protein